MKNPINYPKFKILIENKRKNGALLDFLLKLARIFTFLPRKIGRPWGTKRCVATVLLGGKCRRFVFSRQIVRHAPAATINEMEPIKALSGDVVS